MSTVIPTIFSHSIGDFKKRLSLLVKFAPQLQIDFMDGVFVSSKSAPLSEIPDLKRYKKEFEAHLMVAHPEDWIADLIHKGFGKIIVHIESLQNNDRGLNLIHLIKAMGAQPMLAINPETSIDRLDPFLDNVNHILVMGVSPGEEHQKLAPNTIRRVSTLKKRGIWVQVDGGVNGDTIGKLVTSGVDAVNSGSFIAESRDPKNAYNQLLMAFKKEKKK
ncbi:hypothetical protein FJZ18_00015 [Candidatus Pacearchaeota archaeon]|nr:hypothetical protein [Candidatus Pacearchaeota archaeon]